MGLKNAILIGIVTLVMGGCAASRAVSPADRRAKNQTWYFDCCDPGLDAGTKELCDYAGKDEDHTRWDLDGNKYVYVWSDCKIGGEPWR